MQQSFDISNEEDLSEVVNEILKNLKFKIILLKGNLGAGKTTFTQYFMKALHSKDKVNSPTYAIVNEYDSDNGPVYHFDLYRLNDVNEVYEIGIQDYLDSGQYCLIEWPEIFQEEIDQDYHEISIFMDNNKRILNITI